MDLDAELVILSACNSGGPGGTTAGESLSGLARAFFFAGARALMVSHWDVNDQVGAYLVAGTLGEMRDHPGIGVAAALRDFSVGAAAGGRARAAGRGGASVLLGAVRGDRGRRGTGGVAGTGSGAVELGACTTRPL